MDRGSSADMDDDRSACISVHSLTCKGVLVSQSCVLEDLDWAVQVMLLCRDRGEV